MQIPTQNTFIVENKTPRIENIFNNQDVKFWQGNCKNLVTDRDNIGILFKKRFDEAEDGILTQKNSA